MGNWRTVEINGNIKDNNERQNIRSILKSDWQYYNDDGMFYLHFSDGLASLGEWITENGAFSAIGNLWERDCSIEELHMELTALAELCQSADITVNAGGDWESLECVSSFIIKDGTCTKVDPLKEIIPEISMEMMIGRLMKHLNE